MELQTVDYSDKRLGALRKYFKYLLQFPFALGAVVTMIPAIVLGLATVLGGVLAVLAVVFVSVVLTVAIVAVPAMLLFLAVALGPFSLEEEEA